MYNESIRLNTFTSIRLNTSTQRVLVHNVFIMHRNNVDALNGIKFSVSFEILSDGLMNFEL